MSLQLAQTRVLVTRARGQASALAELLTAEGAEPILIPTIEIAPPVSWCGLDAALSCLRSFDWLLFTSPNAVSCYAQRARTIGVAGEAARRVAVIGPATAKAVEAELGRAPELMAKRFIAEGLAEVLAPVADGASILLVRAAVARDVLPEQLEAAGAAVTVAEAYRSVVPEGSVDALRALFGNARPPHAITFTSASTARNLAELMRLAEVTIPPGVLLASIGPMTSTAMRELGLEPGVEAEEATLPSLLAALARGIRPRN